MKAIEVGDVLIFALSDTSGGYPATSNYPDAGAKLDPYKDRLSSEGEVTLNFGCFLVQADGLTLLVDTGLGPESNGRLIEEIDATGVQRSEVTHVLFTHLHGDHTGWNLDRGTGRPLFPAATYLVPQGDWDHYRAANPIPGSFTRDVAPLEALGCLQLISGEHTISSSLITLPTPGHTPGHTSLLITTQGQHAAIIGDVVLTPIDAEEPSLFTSFDNDKPLAVLTRMAVLDRLEGQSALVGAGHLPSPSLGRFIRQNGRRVWQGI